MGQQEQVSRNLPKERTETEGQSPNLEGPKVLVVIPHPDDESRMAGVIYRITAHLNGKVDLIVVTNGEGGFGYSDLAEKMYKKDLSLEAIGRKELPAIRKEELERASRILGIEKIEMLNQKDDKFTTDEKTILSDKLWDLDRVYDSISASLTKEKYDYVFTLLPTSDEHAAHKATTIIALRAVEGMPEKDRPMVLGVGLESTEANPRPAYTCPEGFSEAMLENNAPELVFNRMVPFGKNNKLNIKQVTTAHMAQYLTQGASLDAAMARKTEPYFVFAISPDDKLPKLEALFKELNLPPSPKMLETK